VDTLLAKLFRRSNESSPQEEDEGKVKDETDST